MRIYKEVLDSISAVANSKSLEIGGILGSAKNSIITDMVADVFADTGRCRFEYYPNIDFLNAQIRNWSKNNIVFMGFFHTHFSGSRNLSDADIAYIKAIMESAKDITQLLYFPVFTLPDHELSVFKAYFTKDQIIIEKDTLEIVEHGNLVT